MCSTTCCAVQDLYHKVLIEYSTAQKKIAQTRIYRIWSRSENSPTSITRRSHRAMCHFQQLIQFAGLFVALLYLKFVFSEI